MAAKIAVGLAVIPVVILAHKAGPDPRRTGAPGDKTCVDSGCHVGPVNRAGGSVVLSTPTGTTYTPGGPAQTITITITDPKATFFGFQLTARQDSSPEFTAAGDFQTVGTQQIIICDDAGIEPSKGCLIGQSDNVEFIEHSFPYPKGTITVSWTPPATNVGTVTLYVAANAATQDVVSTGSHVYMTQLTLCPVLSSGQAMPSIKSGGVQSAGGFSAKAGVAPGTWLEIFGGDFAAAACLWQGADFNGTTAPTSLGGVSVNIGGTNAFIDYVSAGQVNVQVPSGIPIGDSVPLVLSNAAGSSAPYVLKTADMAPALLAPAQAPFLVNGKQYVVAQLLDQSFVGIPSRPAKPGDLLTIYGIGFGPVTPVTAPGDIATQATNLDTNATFLFGQTRADVPYQGLAPSFVGLYQFNVKVPDNVAVGDSPLTVQLGAIKANQNLFVNIGH